MLGKLRCIRVRLRRRPRHIDSDDTAEGRGAVALSALILTLTAAEKAADMIHIPFLKGALGLALVIAETVRVSNPACL
jgi:hypothetical protein